MSSTGGSIPERPGLHRPRPVGLARHIRRFRRASLGDSGHSGHSGASGMENPAFWGPKTVFPGRFSVAFRGFPQLWCLSNSNRCKTSRPSRNTVIYDVSEGSQTLRKRRRSTKIDKKSLRQCFVSESRETNMFFRSPTPLGVDFGRLGALLGAAGCPFWRPRVTRRPPGRCRGTPGMPQDASGTLPRCFRHSLWRHGVSQEGPGTDFCSIVGAPGPLPGPMLHRFLPWVCKQAGEQMVSPGDT